ncbi:MAG: nucleotidyl transferase AbiEii/AbiGii toxin family protein [Candidatus Micrarchaeia archaeon]
MITRELLEKSGEPGFTAGQKEKDYAQHWLLSYFAREGFMGAFKGGTALQKAYGLPRYSEDLDFTLNGAPLPGFDAISRYLSSAGFGIVKWKKEAAGISHSAKLRLQGPLYNGKAISECSISLDFSARENCALAPAMVEIHPAYPDITPYSLLVMDRKEIAAEKVRAVLTRASARDLYDLSFLLRQGFLPDEGMINSKLSYYGMQYSYEAFERAVGKLARLWKVEMNALVAQKPDFEAAKEEVLMKMKAVQTASS